MSFTKKTWINKGETGYENSKVNADNLNNLEDRIEDAINSINEEKYENFGLGVPCKNLEEFSDLDVACGDKTGFYRGSGLVNAPTSGTGADSWYYIIHLVHNEDFQMQIAILLNGYNIYARWKRNGTWGEWEHR